MPASINNTTRSRPAHQDSREAGYMLIGVLVLAALILLALAMAAPRVTVDLQRDKEGELYHRGMQYAGAIRRYYRKFGAYPNSLDQLEKTNNLRFLRKRYPDPITGKNEWRLIRYGQATTIGLNGANVNGTNQGTNLNVNGSGGGTQNSNNASSNSNTFGGGNNNTFGGNNNSTFGNSNSAFGNTNGAGGTSIGSPATGATDTGTGNSGSSLGTSGSGFGNSSSGTNPGPGSGGTSPFGASSGTSATFGGGQIVGVSSTSAKQSIRELKKQTHYNQWEFVYDPNADNRAPGSNGTGVATAPGVPVSPTTGTTPITGTTPTAPPAPTIPPSQ